MRSGNRRGRMLVTSGIRGSIYHRVYVQFCRQAPGGCGSKKAAV